MTRLAEALREMGVTARLSASGRWAEIEVGRGRVYVAAAPRDTAFYTWCDDPAERTVEHYLDPVEAIRAGLRRAARERTEEHSDG